MNLLNLTTGTGVRPVAFWRRESLALRRSILTDSWPFKRAGLGRAVFGARLAGLRAQAKAKKSFERAAAGGRLAAVGRDLGGVRFSGGGGWAGAGGVRRSCFVAFFSSRFAAFAPPLHRRSSSAQGGVSRSRFSDRAYSHVRKSLALTPRPGMDNGL